jgi:hypothetical protein
MSVVINGSAGVTTNSGALYNGIQAGTAVASTSGTSIDFTSIPSWVKRITVMFAGVSTNGTSPILVRLGTSSGFETTSYDSVCGYGGSAGQFETSTAGFNLTLAGGMSAATSFKGSCQISQINGNSYVSSGSVGQVTLMSNGGTKTLSGTLDRVRITTVNGTDTFDAGSINILYE